MSRPVFSDIQFEKFLFLPPILNGFIPSLELLLSFFDLKLEKNGMGKKSDESVETKNLSISQRLY